jgi:flagellar secretion chaperone FliS
MNFFAPQNRRAAQTYNAVLVETGVPSASPHKLILMLFDGAIEAIGTAKLCCEKGEIEEKNRLTSKALRILEEGLRAALDRNGGGQLAQRLDSLYEYMTRRLLSASLHNAPAEYVEVSNLLLELRAGWAGISEAGEMQTGLASH